MILSFQLDRGIAMLTMNHEKHWQGDRSFFDQLASVFGGLVVDELPKKPINVDCWVVDFWAAKMRFLNLFGNPNFHHLHGRGDASGFQGCGELFRCARQRK